VGGLVGLRDDQRDLVRGVQRAQRGHGERGGAEDREPH
jgi:hypothetical protein